MAMGGMTKGQGRRHNKLKAARAARRASGIVEIHKAKHLKQAKVFAAKKAAQFASGHKTPRGTARANRRGNPCVLLGAAHV